MLKKIYDYNPYAMDVCSSVLHKRRYTLEEALEKIPPGAKINFDYEKKRYTVRARNKRYIIMSKPFNLHGYKFAYSIIDIENMEMSRSNIIFDNTNYLDEEECKEAIKLLESGEMELSRRAVARCEDKIKEIWVECTLVKRKTKGEGK